MRTLKRSALVNKPASTLYRLVNDIASYPSFVPGCESARILQSDEQSIVAELAVRRGPLHTRFTTRNRLLPPHRIQLELVAGPMQALTGGWWFEPMGEGGCKVELELRFQFRNPLKALLLERLIEDVATDMVRSFVQRAERAQ